MEPAGADRLGVDLDAQLGGAHRRSSCRGGGCCGHGGRALLGARLRGSGGLLLACLDGRRHEGERCRGRGLDRRLAWRSAPGSSRIAPPRGSAPRPAGVAAGPASRPVPRSPSRGAAGLAAQRLRDVVEGGLWDMQGLVAADRCLELEGSGRLRWRLVERSDDERAGGWRDRGVDVGRRARVLEPGRPERTRSLELGDHQLWQLCVVERRMRAGGSGPVRGRLGLAGVGGLGCAGRRCRRLGLRDGLARGVAFRQRRSLAPGRGYGPRLES